jgi:hypothetical protein
MCLQHFYPYFDVVKTDWRKALKDALTSAATDENENAFGNTLKRMVAQLHDGTATFFIQMLRVDSVSRRFSVGWKDAW